MNEHRLPRRVQLREAKAGLSALVSAAEKGEETIITRHGKAVARIVPMVDYTSRLVGRVVQRG